MEKQEKYILLTLKVINSTLHQSYNGEGAKVASLVIDWKNFNQDWTLNIMFYLGAKLNQSNSTLLSRWRCRSYK